MKTILSIAFILASIQTVNAAEPVAGGTTLGVSVAVVQQLAYGWSLKRDALGKAVYNDKNDKIGKVEDVIVAPNKTVSYAIISTGGFLGMAKHDVAIPVDQLKKEDNGKITLAGATKESLKAMPEFEYAKNKAE